MTDERRRKLVITALTIMYIFPFIIAAIAIGLAINASDDADEAKGRLLEARDNLCVILNEDRTSIQSELEMEGIIITLRKFDCTHLALTGDLTNEPPRAP